MSRLEYFREVIKVVTELMEVTDQEILSKARSAEVVDARWMTIVLMRERGYSTRQIAPLLCRPERTINHALSFFNERVKYSQSGLGNIVATARQILSNIQ